MNRDAIIDRVRAAAPVLLPALALALFSVFNIHVVVDSRAMPRSTVQRHELWQLLGFALACGLALADYRRLLRAAYGIYGVCVALLALTFVFGERAHGAARWITLGRYTLQPSEFAVLGITVALARWDRDRPSHAPRTLRELALPIALVALPSLLTWRQPDLGSAIVLALTGAAVIALRPMRTSAALALFAGSAAATALLLARGLHSYQLARLRAFLHPDPSAGGYQSHRAVQTLGAGGLFGHHREAWLDLPRAFVPAVLTDLPMVSWGFLTGFVGVAAALALFAAVVHRGLRVASQSEDRFGAALCVGASASWAAHALINLGMTFGLLPIVGVTLPLMSYGGSGTITSWLCVGIIASVASSQRSASNISV